MPFCLILRNLHSCPFGVHRASQRCACSPKQLCLIFRSCLSVQAFVVSLTSVLTSRLATLRLTNASRHSLPRCITGTPAHKGLTPSGLSLIAQRTLIYLPFKAHTNAMNAWGSALMDADSGVCKFRHVVYIGSVVWLM